jgi:hypothetical protein
MHKAEPYATRLAIQSAIRSRTSGAALRIDDVSVRLADPLPGNAIQRFLIPRPQEQIEISWSGDSARFITPRATDVRERIGRCLEAVKRIPR